MSPKLSIQISIILFAMICFSCFTPDVDKGEVNKLRPEINQNTNVNVDPNANVSKDNENELINLVNLPFDPVENDYREDTADTANPEAGETPDPNKKNLKVVLKFSDDDKKKLIEQLEKKGQPFQTKVDPEPWFPAELTAKSQMSGDESIKGTGYSAEFFYKEPFNKGTLTKVDETDYFVLILQNY